MDLRARVALASGAAGAVGAGLLLAGRLAGSLVAALVLASIARAAPAAALLESGSLASAVAARALRRQAVLAPAWALAVAAATYRAGSSELVDVRGAHAVAGVALARGSGFAVAGAWLVLVAVAVAVAGAGTAGVRTEAHRGHAGVVAVPTAAVRLSWLAAAVQALLGAALVAGPRVGAPGDVVPWVLAGGPILFIVSRGAAIGARPEIPPLALAAGALGLALALVGGRP